MSTFINFKGSYWLNDDGCVFNANYHSTGKWKELSYDYSRNGYKSATISVNGKVERFMVHRLVAQYFVPNPDPERYQYIDHWNDDRTDSRAENLHWVTIAENNQKESKRQRLSNSIKGHRHSEGSKMKMSKSQSDRQREADGKVKGKPVIETDLDGKERIWASCKEAGDFYGFHKDTIAKCARGERATAVEGRKWRYADSGDSTAKT